MATEQDTPSNAARARPVSARVGEIAMAAAVLAAALFFVWQSVLLPFGGIALPGPGFFPIVLGSVLGMLALAILYHISRTAGDGEAVPLGHRDVLIVLAALIGVAVAFERAGTYVTLGVFAAILLRLVARTTLWRAVLGASLGMAAVWGVFRLGLGVRLPTGQLWDTVRDLLAAKFSGVP